MQKLTRQQYRLNWLKKRLEQEKKEKEALGSISASTLSLDAKLAKIGTVLQATKPSAQIFNNLEGLTMAICKRCAKILSTAGKAFVLDLCPACQLIIAKGERKEEGKKYAFQEV